MWNWRGLTVIAARALDHGHGGMILLVPSTLRAPAGVRIHYQVGEGRNVLAQRYAEITRGIPLEHRLQRLSGSRERAPDGRVYVRDEVQIAFAEAIEFVARLTAIDNAVLLDTDLHVRGFGVQVIEAEAPQIKFTHASPYSSDVRRARGPLNASYPPKAVSTRSLMVSPYWFARSGKARPTIPRSL